MSNKPILLVITPETILDLYLECGMPQELYYELLANMDNRAKEALTYLTLAGLGKLNGKASLGEALYMILSTLVKASKEYEIDRNKPIDND